MCDLAVGIGNVAREAALFTKLGFRVGIFFFYLSVIAVNVHYVLSHLHYVLYYSPLDMCTSSYLAM